MAIWYIILPFGMYIVWSLGIVSPFLVRCTKKNLATIPQRIVVGLSSDEQPQFSSSAVFFA
jgi:hypothetical protein